MSDRWGERRWVSFTPQRIDDLKPHAAAWMHREFEVIFEGTMDEGDYEGQSMWMPVDHDVMDGLVTWIPDCDLTDVAR